MRYFSGEIIESKGRFNHPASIIISGSSGVGKTTFAYNLIKNQHFSREIKNLHYFGCGSKYATDKLDWHKRLKNVAVHYHDGLPSSAFFGSLERDSCVIIDDQFDEAIKESSIRQAFKVDRRHSKFSIVLISQSIFDNGKLSKGIRNNCEVWVLFKNFGDANTNPLLVRNMKLTKRYKKCLEDIEEFPHGYTVINNSPLLECESLRVSTNIFGENKQISNFPIFYPKN